jgi:hypothetical protein
MLGAVVDLFETARKLILSKSFLHDFIRKRDDQYANMRVGLQVKKKVKVTNLDQQTTNLDISIGIRSNAKREISATGTINCLPPNNFLESLSYEGP